MSLTSVNPSVDLNLVAPILMTPAVELLSLRVLRQISTDPVHDCLYLALVGKAPISSPLINGSTPSQAPALAAFVRLL